MKKKFLFTKLLNDLMSFPCCFLVLYRIYLTNLLQNLFWHKSLVKEEGYNQQIDILHLTNLPY